MSAYILGIWDGHDSGAALIKGSEIIFAANNERFVGRKLDVAFPSAAIKAALSYASINPEAIGIVAYSTYDFAKTLTRVWPQGKEEYYLIRRRKLAPSPLMYLKKAAKYLLTEIPPQPIFRTISNKIIRRQLGEIGIVPRQLKAYDHHLCHAYTAAATSPFPEQLVVTVDGIGDGRSGVIYSDRGGRLEELYSIPGRASAGIFFEHATNLLNMRELEDEGKVMALANFAYPIPDDLNPLLKILIEDGDTLKLVGGSWGAYRAMRKLLWYYPSEQFAYMAQRTLEIRVVELVAKALRNSGHKYLALAGGVASNIKINRLIRKLPGLEDLYIFPHMGDGGLALGAALVANHRVCGTRKLPLPHLYLGPSSAERTIEKTIQKSGYKYQRLGNPVTKAAEMLASGQIILWYQGRMEYGPRSLGNRSILARADRVDLKDKLNLSLKKRVWYQPFCPSMLQREAPRLLADFDSGTNRAMTMGYQVAPDYRSQLAGVINVDGSCRPQFVGGENPLFQSLLEDVLQRTGVGCLLNTSMNVHGKPLVNTPDDAMEVMRDSGIEYLFIGDFLVVKGAN